MRIVFFTLFIGLLPCLATAQNDIESLLEGGVKLFNEGKYEQAIAEYEKVLKLDEGNSAALYEIGYSYYALKDFEKALKFAEKVIKNDKGNFAAAYTLKGNILDDQGKSAKAIKVYEEGIKKSPDNHLLHFNLAMSHYRLNEKEAAEINFQQAINIKLTHGSSHYFLGKLNADNNKRMPSMLGLYFFLLLEPTGGRAEDAFGLLQQQMSQGVERKDSENVQLNISLGQLEGEFSPMEVMLALLSSSPEALQVEDKTPEGKFAATTEMLFSILAANKAEKSGFYWDLYVDLFVRINKAGHTKTFSYYISQSKSPAAAVWVDENAKAVDDFFKWLNE